MLVLIVSQQSVNKSTADHSSCNLASVYFYIFLKERMNHTWGNVRHKEGMLLKIMNTMII
jgi:hypothetical protein